MLDYKDIIIKHYALSLSGSEIARQLGVSKSGVNDFLRAFDKCESISYPLPPGITNYGIAELVYGSVPRSGGRNESIEYPDYESDARLMATRKNMTLVFLWNRSSYWGNHDYRCLCGNTSVFSVYLCRRNALHKRTTVD